MVKLLLADVRIDPSENSNAVLMRAILLRRPELVVLLMKDKRVRTAIDDTILRAAHDYVTSEIYSLVEYAFGR